MLRIGIMGVGHLGKFHLNNWQEIEGMQIIGFFDPNDAQAKAVQEKYQVKRFESAEELIDACDAVDIVAPTIFHFELCALALRKGKHVFGKAGKGSQYQIPGGACGAFQPGISGTKKLQTAAHVH